MARTEPPGTSVEAQSVRAMDRAMSRWWNLVGFHHWEGEGQVGRVGHEGHGELASSKSAAFILGPLLQSWICR